MVCRLLISWRTLSFVCSSRLLRLLSTTSFGHRLSLVAAFRVSVTLFRLLFGDLLGDDSACNVRCEETNKITRHRPAARRIRRRIPFLSTVDSLR